MRQVTLTMTKSVRSISQVYMGKSALVHEHKRPQTAYQLRVAFEAQTQTVA